MTSGLEVRGGPFLPHPCKKQIKSFFILAVIRRNVERVCGAHLRWHYCARVTQLLPKKRRSGGESLATLCPIWRARDLNRRPPAPETNALPLDQLPVRFRLWSGRSEVQISDPSNRTQVLPTDRHRCDISSKEVKLPGRITARRWAPQTHYTPRVLQRVYSYNLLKDLTKRKLWLEGIINLSIFIKLINFCNNKIDFTKNDWFCEKTLKVWAKPIRKENIFDKRFLNSSIPKISDLMISK